MNMRPLKATHGTITAYQRGCGCDECKAAWNHYHKTAPSQQAYRRALTQAATFVRHEMPDKWNELLDEAYAELGAERRPVGRPRS